ALPVVIAGGLALTFSLAACGSGGDLADSTGGSSAGEVTAGGTLTFAASQSAGCLDPQQLAQAITMTVGRQITDSLTVQDPESGEIEPWLASDWEVSEDGTIFTFTLIDGATFSDGT